MYRFLRQTTLAGLAGLALGLMPAAVSATSPKASAAATAPQAQQHASRVELAWMADSRTFTLPVEARAEGAQVVITGKVPDQATRQHVLQVARQAGYAAVVDRLTVLDAPVAPRDENAVLRLAAVALIRTSLGDKGQDINVVASEDGTIELHGKVDTVEQRLKASKCLRGLPGCTRVENYLDPAGAEKPIVPVSATAGPPPAPAPVLPAPQEAPPEVVPHNYPTGPGPLVGAPTAAPRVPAQVPTTRYVHIPTRVAPVGTAGVVEPRVLGYSQPKPTGYPYPGHALTDQTVHMGVAQHVPPPTLWQRMRNLMPWNKTCDCTTPVPAPVLSHPMPYPAPPQAAPMPRAMEPSAAATHQRTPVHVTAWPPAYRQEAPVQQARATVPAPQNLPAPVRPRVVLTGASETAPVAAPHPAAARQMVLAHCGNLVRQVDAHIDHDNRLTLQVYAAPKAEHQLSEKLLQAFANYGSNVRIHIHLAP